MIRQKVVIGNYIFIVDFFRAGEDLKNPTYKNFYLLRNFDFISGVMCDRSIYFIDKSTYEGKDIIYPINDNTMVGYTKDYTVFNSDLNEDNFERIKYSLYKKVNDSFEIDEETNQYKDADILCDMIRIYFPTIKNSIDAIIDVENFINDIKYHYIIDDINNYEKHSTNEFTIDHQIYSEYINVYIPSINSLLYDNSIYIHEYNDCEIHNGTEYVTLKGNNNENLIDGKLVIPFNLLYYPFEINTTYDQNHKAHYSKRIITKGNYINNQFYSTLNLILYPYEKLDEFKMFISDYNLNLNSTTFNIHIDINLNTVIKFPVYEDFKDDTLWNKYYGVPCAVSKFNIKDDLQKIYLSLNGLTIDDYYAYDENDESMINYKDEDDEYFGEDLWEIKKTGFYIEMATDKRFKNVFFKYKINIDFSNDNIVIDDFIFPLNNIFQNWNDVPNIIIYRVTFIDKVACIKIQSNPVVITDEWYKYIIDSPVKSKLHLNKVYKYVKGKMLVGNYNNSENPILFIDKINCSIVKENNDEQQGIEIVKNNAPKVIYKPVFYRTAELQNITIKSGVTQNIGINLDEYMTKVETFKLLIGNNEYIEYGRNNTFVIFKINSAKLNDTSGRYIVTNEDNEYISDGTYIIN